MLYSSLGGLVKERFGTDTAIYNKLFYNSRGQLAEIREGTSYTGLGDTGWERGAIINFYAGCWGMCGGHNSTTAMTDNNGNLKRQEIYIPNNSSPTFAQTFDYDSLNRLQRVTEGSSWQQEYVYDRYGNRTIHQTNTWGAVNGPAINKKDFTVSTANNRLGVPNGQSGTMSYDNAGNLTVDTYSAAAVLRAYDAENRMTKETQANSVVAGDYTYNADGQRVRRTVGGVTTWQVYGFDGELLAEYAASGAAAAPQKEYGYRNGQLLITASVTAGSGGTAYTFTDDPLVVNVTSVKAVHLTELRAAVDQARAHGGLAAASWAESISSGVTLVKASHITELRARLAEARAALGMSAASYTDPNLTIGDTIKAAHVQELRARTNEALTAGGTGGIDVEWLVTDQLGTPRMIFDKSGSLANTKHHDYLPFGEELIAGQGGRTPTQGYAADSVRQKFTRKERDNETGLDYFGARYYASVQGRFTSVDPAGLKLRHLANPQDLNRYAYVSNNPLLFVDPDGEEKVKIIVETFIPAPVVVAPGIGPRSEAGFREFRGDFNDKGEQVSSRTTQVIVIETDPNRNGGGPQYSNEGTKFTGESVEYFVGTRTQKGDSAFASGDTLKADVFRDQNGSVNTHASGNEANPLVEGSPGITSDLNISVQPVGPNGTTPQGQINVTVTGQHDAFPAFRVNVQREGSAKLSTVYSYDPRKTGATGLSLIPLAPNVEISPVTTTIDPERRRNQ